mmetsp:Transcript_86265/g.268023  ORF Transcript_86265/g.268023 Transcript_86265/m.268023 type:complete len:265 (+) Transcript_86265:298-1092(+)
MASRAWAPAWSGVAGRSTWPSGVNSSSRFGCCATRPSGSGPMKPTSTQSCSATVAAEASMPLPKRVRVRDSQSAAAKCHTSAFSETGRPKRASGGGSTPAQEGSRPETRSRASLVVSKPASFHVPSSERHTVSGDTPQWTKPHAWSLQRPARIAFATSLTFATVLAPGSDFSKFCHKRRQGKSSMTARWRGSAKATSRSLMNSRPSESRASSCSRSTNILTSTSPTRSQTWRTRLTSSHLSNASKNLLRPPRQEGLAGRLAVTE